MSLLTSALSNIRRTLVILLAMVPMDVDAQPSGEPLSAIEWLSDSVVDDVPVREQQQPTGRQPDRRLVVAPLGSNVADSSGVVEASALGLSRDLWVRNSAAELADRLTFMPPIAIPSLRNYYADLVAARFDPPADAILDESFFLARVDALMALARFDEASEMLRQAEVTTPERFRRFFDIGLLTGEEAQACALIGSTPEVSASFPARIFCLARNGQWDVAALTLGTAEALGILTDQEDQLLLRFLDPDLFEQEPIPQPSEVSPLLFRLYEAIGERPATDRLPVAFAVTDLSETVGWKDQLTAAERLVAIGAIRPGDFLSIVRARQPAASGGIWTRVELLQEFDSASKSDPASLSKLLPGAWGAALDGGYAHELAPWFLSKLRTAELDSSAQHTAFEVALLAGDTAAAAGWSGSRDGDASLLALAQGRPSNLASPEPLQTAIRQSLAGLPPSEPVRQELSSGRAGSVLLDAIEMLAVGHDGDPRGIGDALAVLMALGLEGLAAEVSVEMLLGASRI